MTATAKIEKGNLVITIPLEEDPQPSQSGKTLVVASTRGFAKTTAKVDNKDVSISVNACISNK
jgi:hypothetical protein